MEELQPRIEAEVGGLLRKNVTRDPEWFYGIDEDDRAPLWNRFAEIQHWMRFPEDTLHAIIIRGMVDALDLYASAALRDPKRRTYDLQILLCGFDVLESGESAAASCSISVNPLGNEDASVLHGPRTPQAKRVVHWFDAASIDPQRYVVREAGVGEDGWHVYVGYREPPNPAVRALV